MEQMEPVAETSIEPNKNVAVAEVTESVSDESSNYKVLVKASSNGELSASKMLAAIDLDSSASQRPAEELPKEDLKQTEQKYNEEEKENTTLAETAPKIHDEPKAENEEIIDGFSFLAYDTDIELKKVFEIRRQEYKLLHSNGEVHQKKTPSKSKSCDKTSDFQRQKSSISSTSSASETPAKSGKKPKDKSSNRKSSKKPTKKPNSNSSNSSFISNDEEDTQTESTNANEMDESITKCELSNEHAESTNQESKANLTTQSSSGDLNESKIKIKSENIPLSSVYLDATNVKAKADSNNNFISPENRLIAETEAAAHKAAMESLAKFGQQPYHNGPFFHGQPHNKEPRFNQMSNSPNFFNPNLPAPNGNNSANRDMEMMKMINFMEIKNQNQDQKQPSKHQNRDRSSGSSATNPLHYKPPAPHQQQQSQSQSPAELAFISSLLADPSFNPATLPPHLQHVFHTFLLQSSKQPTDNPFFNKASFPLLPQQQQSLKHSLFPGQLPSPIEKSRYSPFSIEHNKNPGVCQNSQKQQQQQQQSIPYNPYQQQQQQNFFNQQSKNVNQANQISTNSAQKQQQLQQLQNKHSPSVLSSPTQHNSRKSTASTSAILNSSTATTTTTTSTTSTPLTATELLQLQANKKPDSANYNHKANHHNINTSNYNPLNNTSSDHQHLLAKQNLLQHPNIFNPANHFYQGAESPARANNNANSPYPNTQIHNLNSHSPYQNSQQKTQPQPTDMFGAHTPSKTQSNHSQKLGGDFQLPMQAGAGFPALPMFGGGFDLANSSMSPDILRRELESRAFMQSLGNQSSAASTSPFPPHLAAAFAQQQLQQQQLGHQLSPAGAHNPMNLPFPFMNGLLPNMPMPQQQQFNNINSASSKPSEKKVAPNKSNDMTPQQLNEQHQQMLMMQQFLRNSLPGHLMPPMSQMIPPLSPSGHQLPPSMFPGMPANMTNNKTPSSTSSQKSQSKRPSNPNTPISQSPHNRSNGYTSSMDHRISSKENSNNNKTNNNNAPSFSSHNVNSKHNNSTHNNNIPPHLLLPSFSPFNNNGSSTSPKSHINNSKALATQQSQNTTNGSDPAGKWNTAHIKIAHMIMSDQGCRKPNPAPQQNHHRQNSPKPTESHNHKQMLFPPLKPSVSNTTSPSPSAKKHNHPAQHQFGNHSNQQFPIQPSFQSHGATNGHKTNHNQASTGNSVKSTTASASTFYPPIQSPTTPFGGLASQQMTANKQPKFEHSHLDNNHHRDGHRSKHKSHNHQQRSHHSSTSQSESNKSRQRSRSRSPILTKSSQGHHLRQGLPPPFPAPSNKDGLGNGPLMAPNHLATEAAITAYAQLMMADKQRQDMLRLSGSNLAGKHSNSATPLPPGMLPPFPGMPHLPPHHYLSMMGHFNPNGMPATTPFNQSQPIPNLPPPPASKSPNTMLTMQQQQAKLLQSLPQNMNESDFIRMISTQMQSSSKPAATDRVSTPPSTTSSPKPRSPKRTDSAAQAINSHNLFLQQLFENINRKGLDTSTVAEGKRKTEEAATDSEASKHKHQKTKHSYSIENLFSKSEDTNSEEDLASTNHNNKLSIEESGQKNCEEIKEDADGGAKEDKDETSCHTVKLDDEDKAVDDTEEVNEATEIEETDKLDESEAVEDQPKADSVVEEIKENEGEVDASEVRVAEPAPEVVETDNITEDKGENEGGLKTSEVGQSEPMPVEIETENITEDKGENEGDKYKDVDLEEGKETADVEDFESVSSDNEVVKQNADAAADV